MFDRIRRVLTAEKPSTALVLQDIPKAYPIPSIPEFYATPVLLCPYCVLAHQKSRVEEDWRACSHNYFDREGNRHSHVWHGHTCDNKHHIWVMFLGCRSCAPGYEIVRINRPPRFEDVPPVYYEGP